MDERRGEERREKRRDHVNNWFVKLLICLVWEQLSLPFIQTATFSKNGCHGNQHMVKVVYMFTIANITTLKIAIRLLLHDTHVCEGKAQLRHFLGDAKESFNSVCCAHYTYTIPDCMCLIQCVLMDFRKLDISVFSWKKNCITENWNSKCVCECLCMYNTQ